MNDTILFDSINHAGGRWWENICDSREECLGSNMSRLCRRLYWNHDVNKISKTVERMNMREKVGL
jgi:hypothetical protein